MLKWGISRAILRKKLPFLGISTTIKIILRDRNYKKYAIKVRIIWDKSTILIHGQKKEH